MKKYTKQVRVKIKKLGINGEGIGYVNKTILFVPGALPKEEVLVKITNQKRNFMEGKLIKVLKPSPERVQPKCAYYDQCGGCQLQHLSARGQKRFKEDIIRQSLKKFQLDNSQNIPILKTIGMKYPWNYRNKLQFQVRRQNQQIAVGLYKENSHQLINISDCPVQEPLTMNILQTVHQLIEKYHLRPYDERHHDGFIRTVIVRIGRKTNEAQVTLVTRTTKFANQSSFIRDLIAHHPEIKSIVQNVNTQQTALVMGDKEHVLWGKRTIDETIGNETFHLSSHAFLQLNPQQTEVLYQEAFKALDAQQDDIIIDAYCGIGTIGLSLAKKVNHVYGMDIIPAAIEDARNNAKDMNIHNVSYETGTAEKWIPQWLKTGIRPDGMIVDPPRTGLEPSLIQTILKYPIPKLVYVSCNPSTMARDLKELAKLYEIQYIQSVDMFPQTARVEAVAKLTLRK